MDLNKLYKLAKEYLDDPNCHPRDWVIGENLKQNEIDKFIFYVNYIRDDNEGEIAFSEAHPELNP